MTPECATFPLASTAAPLPMTPVTSLAGSPVLRPTQHTAPVLPEHAAQLHAQLTLLVQAQASQIQPDHMQPELSLNNLPEAYMASLGYRTLLSPLPLSAEDMFSGSSSDGSQLSRCNSVDSFQSLFADAALLQTPPDSEDERLSEEQQPDSTLQFVVSYADMINPLLPSSGELDTTLQSLEALSPLQQLTEEAPEQGDTVQEMLAAMEMLSHPEPLQGLHPPSETNIFSSSELSDFNHFLGTLVSGESTPPVEAAPRLDDTLEALLAAASDIPQAPAVNDGDVALLSGDFSHLPVEGSTSVDSFQDFFLAAMQQ